MGQVKLHLHELGTNQRISGMPKKLVDDIHPGCANFDKQIRAGM